MDYIYILMQTYLHGGVKKFIRLHGRYSRGTVRGYMYAVCMPFVKRLNISRTIKSKYFEVRLPDLCLLRSISSSGRFCLCLFALVNHDQHYYHDGYSSECEYLMNKPISHINNIRYEVRNMHRARKLNG